MYFEASLHCLKGAAPPLQTEILARQEPKTLTRFEASLHGLKQRGGGGGGGRSAPCFKHNARMMGFNQNIPVHHIS